MRVRLTILRVRYAMCPLHVSWCEYEDSEDLCRIVSVGALRTGVPKIEAGQCEHHVL